MTAPAASLAVGLMLAAGLLWIPAPWRLTMQGYAAALVQPGQAGVLSLREHGGRIAARVTSHFAAAARLAEVRRRQAQLVRQNRRLTIELEGLRSRLSRSAEDSDDDGLDRLLTARCVKTRVLGRQARTFLARRHLLDVGSAEGVQPGTLVVDAPPERIDQGRDAGLSAGQLVLRGSRVWGKVVEVGRHTSTVQTVTEAGYRDLVRLGHFGPQGILEGTGQPLARVRLIEVTEPVAVGDTVCAAATEGILREPPLYGQVARLERPIGAAHWEIWVRPAVDPHQTDQLAVLQVELNPLRVAARR